MVCFRLAFILATAALLTVGCHRKASVGLSASDLAAFAQAPPDVKQVWDTARSADQTNNYAMAQTLYFSLLRQSLPPPERDAVSKASTALNERLYAGAQKGDPEAVAALKELQSHPPNRPAR